MIKKLIRALDRSFLSAQLLLRQDNFHIMPFLIFTEEWTDVLFSSQEFVIRFRYAPVCRIPTACFRLPTFTADKIHELKNFDYFYSYSSHTLTLLHDGSSKTLHSIADPAPLEFPASDPLPDMDYLWLYTKTKEVVVCQESVFTRFRPGYACACGEADPSQAIHGARFISIQLLDTAVRALGFQGFACHSMGLILTKPKTWLLLKRSKRSTSNDPIPLRESYKRDFPCFKVHMKKPLYFPPEVENGLLMVRGNDLHLHWAGHHEVLGRLDLPYHFYTTSYKRRIPLLLLNDMARVSRTFNLYLPENPSHPMAFQSAHQWCWTSV